VDSSCGGFANLPCPVGFVCIDDPDDACDVDCGNPDCLGICVKLCGTPRESSALAVHSTGLVQWERVACVDTYNLYRLTTTRFEDADADGLADDYGSCFATSLPLPEAMDGSDPPPGWCHFYLATGVNLLGEGPMGFNSALQERPNFTPCP
jgi:hypothetical protein